MSKRVEARRLNRLATDRAIKRLTVATAKIEGNVMVALDDIGRESVTHSVATHTFNNRTGNLESGYSYKVLPPNSSGMFEYKALNEAGGMDVRSEKTEVTLFIGNGVRYAIFVELKHGFDVSIQTFNWLRVELGKKLKEKLRSRRIA